MTRDTPDRDFVQTLQRGLAVILAFSDQRSRLTATEVAEVTDLSRPATRRILLTLEKLGYVRTEGRYFALTPRVLTLGQAYLSSLNLTDIAQPHMEQVVDETRESCSMATLDDTEIVYVARVPTRRIMSINLSVGTRLPAHATSMGRVLLADLSAADLDRYFTHVHLEPLTPHTVTDEERLREILAEVRKRGWALVDQELEEGIRSIATPIRSFTGRVVAAINSSTHAGRVDTGTLQERFLPVLLETAAAISSDLGRKS